LQKFPNLKKKITLKIAPKIFAIILEFIYSGELVLNHLTLKELLSLLEFSTNQDIELIVPLILEYLLLSTHLNEREVMIKGIIEIETKQSEKEKENKNSKLSSNLEKLKIAIKIISLLQSFFQIFLILKTIESKTINEDPENKTSELWWEKIHVPQKKIIESFYQDLQKLHSDQTLANFEIETANEQKFPVHLPILIARSHYFQAINEMKMDEFNNGKLKLQNISNSQMFEIFLRYLYMGFYSIPKGYDHSEALELLKMANYFDLKTTSLNVLMENYIMESINQNSCLEILDLSDKMNFHQLKMKSLDFVCRNYKDIIQSNLTIFESFPKPLLIEIMQHLANYTS